MNKVQQGFTLIELMIVVAIIGILAAIALPAYQDYTVRSKMSECITAISACKTSVQESFADRGVLPADAAAAGCSTTGTAKCAAPTVAAGVVTVAALAAGIGSPLTANCNLVLTPTVAGGVITGWSGTATTCDDKYVPGSFR